MAGSVLEAAVMLREALAGFDPRLLSGADCALVAEGLAATEKACAAARTAAGARAIETGAHRERGFADGIAWLACHAGTTSGAARQAVQTAAAVEDCPPAHQALVAGELSLAEAAEIVGTEAEVPGSTEELMAVAKSKGLSAVRDRGRDLRLGGADPTELHDRQHRARRFRHWRDQQGMICFTGALPPEVGVPLVNRIEIETERFRRQARRDG
ncbi:MAG: hypothetical protein J2P57_23890, partial [Acidimicrobiaceae bacterium]|nr:hypothetical protein [Acidimicrobiaceae bacterium]